MEHSMDYHKQMSPISNKFEPCRCIPVDVHDPIELKIPTAEKYASFIAGVCAGLFFEVCWRPVYFTKKHPSRNVALTC